MFTHLTFAALVQLCDDYLVNLPYESTYIPSDTDEILQRALDGGDYFLYELYLLLVNHDTTLSEAEEHYSHLSAKMSQLINERDASKQYNVPVKIRYVNPEFLVAFQQEPSLFPVQYHTFGHRLPIKPNVASSWDDRVRRAFTLRRRQHRKMAQQLAEVYDEDYSDDSCESSDDESELCTASTCSSCYTQPGEYVDSLCL